MENIGYFLLGAREYGLRDSELFITVDLFNQADMQQVRWSSPCLPSGRGAARCESERPHPRNIGCQLPKCLEETGRVAWLPRVGLRLTVSVLSYLLCLFCLSCLF